MPISATEFENATIVAAAVFSEDEVIGKLSAETAYNTSEVAERLGVDNKEKVLNALKALDKAGRIRGKKIGVTFYWMLPVA